MNQIAISKMNNHSTIHPFRKTSEYKDQIKKTTTATLHLIGRVVQNIFAWGC